MVEVVAILRNQDVAQKDDDEEKSSWWAGLHGTHLGVHVAEVRSLPKAQSSVA